MITGGELSRAQIERHGRDRYPTQSRQAIKVMIEAAELVDAIEAHGFEGGYPRGVPASIRRELADTGLALYALANKLGLDLIAEMRELVETDTRDFRGGG